MSFLWIVSFAVVPGGEAEPEVEEDSLDVVAGAYRTGDWVPGGPGVGSGHGASAVSGLS